MRGLLGKIAGFFAFRTRKRLEHIISKLERHQLNLFRDLPEVKKRISILEKLYKNKVRILKLAEKPNFRNKIAVGPTQNSLINILETQKDLLVFLKSKFLKLDEELKDFNQVYRKFLSTLEGKGQTDFARVQGMPQVFQEFSGNIRLLERVTQTTSQMIYSINPYIKEIQEQESIVESSSMELRLTITRLKRVAGESFMLDNLKSNYNDSQERLEQEFGILRDILSKLREAKAVYDQLIKRVTDDAVALDAFLYSNNGKFVSIHQNNVYLAIFVHEQYYFPISILHDGYIKKQINKDEKGPQAEYKFLMEYSVFLREFRGMMAEFGQACSELIGAFNIRIAVLKPYYEQRLGHMNKTLDKLVRIIKECEAQYERIQSGRYGG